MRRFKSILYGLATVVATASGALAQQPTIAWQPDIPTAQQLATQSNKLVLVHFWAPWCKPCAKLEQEVLSRPETAQALNANFACVKINTEDSVNIARAYNVTSLPTDVVLSADGRLIAQLPCPQASNQYIQQITQVADGYRQLTGQLAAGANRAGDYSRQLSDRAQNSLAGLATTGVGAPTVPPQASPTVNNTPPAAIAAPSQGPTMASPGPKPVGPTQGAPISAYADNRYADYMRDRHVDVKATTPAAAAGTYPPQIPASAEHRTQGVIQPPPAALPPGSPPLALDGYCAVQLREQKKWLAGDRRWGAVHRGRTYLFSGPEEQKKFLEAPDSYAPVISGNDPVLALDNGQAVPGRREHGVFFENRIYLFADEASLQRFYQNPNRYAAEVVQARR